MAIDPPHAAPAAAGSTPQRVQAMLRPGHAMPEPFYAMWSPHRDSREVMLWKSMLAFRGEPWHWVDRLDAAHWYVVDVSRGVAPQWTEMLRSQEGRVRGIALARQWTDVPAPCWTFFKVPLRHDRVLHWLDQEMRRQERLQQIQADATPTVPRRPEPAPAVAAVASAPAPLLPARERAPLHPRWEDSDLRLTRWPDVTRYGAGSIDLIVACGMMLRNWTPYTTVAATVQDARQLEAMLTDASRRGFLQIADRSATTSPGRLQPEVGGAAEDGRWGLLKRLWKRFS
ncbi:MAG: hypothetical protein RJA44_2231 [Pseudomonadota bacterium]